jgi:hypothetical protein
MANMENSLASIPPEKELSYGKAKFHLWYPTPYVMRLAAFGYGEAPLVALVTKEMDEAGRKAGRPIAVFTDDRGLTGYEPAYRQAFEAWVYGCWDRVASIHLLVDSAVVEMGMAVVSMKIGDRGIYEMYRDFPDWYARYQKALAEHGK